MDILYVKSSDLSLEKCSTSIKFVKLGTTKKVKISKKLSQPRCVVKIIRRSINIIHTVKFLVYNLGFIFIHFYQNCSVSYTNVCALFS